MSHRFRRVFACVYSALLVLFTLYAALDIFVIPHRITAVAHEETSVAQADASGPENTGTAENDSALPSGPRIVKTAHGQTLSGNTAELSPEEDTTAQAEANPPEEDTTAQAEAYPPEQTAANTAQGEPLAIDGTVIGTYEDGQSRITVTLIRAYDTDIYIADILLSSHDALQTAFASDTYGRNVKDETSAIADAHGAVLAVNGDFYGSRTEGYVIRNGTLYRDTAGKNREGLAILEDGSFLFYEEPDVSAQTLLSQGAVQAFSFGPVLLRDGEITVSETEEVGKAMASNPRTAIGMVDDLHYAFVVSDGRTNASEGLSLYELAQVMREAGVREAYNLDGGGSSTMVFQGSVINNPTTSGKNTREREVSDIIYIGGESK